MWELPALPTRWYCINGPGHAQRTGGPHGAPLPPPLPPMQLRIIFHPDWHGSPRDCPRGDWFQMSLETTPNENLLSPQNSCSKRQMSRGQSEKKTPDRSQAHGEMKVSRAPERRCKPAVDLSDAAHVFRKALSYSSSSLLSLSFLFTPFLLWYIHLSFSLSLSFFSPPLPLLLSPLYPSLSKPIFWWHSLICKRMGPYQRGIFLHRLWSKRYLWSKGEPPWAVQREHGSLMAINVCLWWG